MYQRIEKLFRSETPLLLAALLLFVSLDLVNHWRLALVELGIMALLLLYLYFRRRRRKAELNTLIEAIRYNADSATGTALLHFPMSVVAFDPDSGEVLWGNDCFWSLFGNAEGREEQNLFTLLPALPLDWLRAGENTAPAFYEREGRRYLPEGYAVSHAEGGERSIAVLYLSDRTELLTLQEEYAASRPAEMVILIDNYEELMKPLTDRQRIELRGRLDETIEKWSSGLGGLMRRFDRDRYLFIFERRHLQGFTDSRFTLLDEIEQVVSPAGIRATASIGVGIDAEGFEGCFSYASMAAELAMSRGGDQAVVKSPEGYDYYGGRGAEVETRSAVHARVVASSLKRLIEESGEVFIMGHSYADLDTAGAAAGLIALCRKFGKNAALVLGDGPNAIEPLLNALWKTPAYANALCTPAEAMQRLTPASLLIIVDTNRPEQVEDAAVLSAIPALAMIDHHRRTDTYIDKAAVEYLEPFASSAAELVTELLAQLLDGNELTRSEADALLSGIMMDTKNFTIRTGERTFAAASWLGRAGADTTRVKLLLQNGMEETVARYNILRHAEVYKDIAVAALTEPQNRVVASQAADELLNIRGITASVVFYPTAAGGVDFSARSIGSVNAQVLLEKLGGGGNMSAAGAQMRDISPEEAKARLFAAIDEYFETE